MQIVYTGEEMPQSFTKSIFLAGPTSRNKEVPSWRPDALQLLDDMGFDGVVFLPEDRNGEVHLDYDDQTVLSFGYHAIYPRIVGASLNVPL
jgi:hypothetical protein